MDHSNFGGSGLKEGLGFRGCALIYKGPSSPYLQFLIPKKGLKSYNRKYLDPLTPWGLGLCLFYPLITSFQREGDTGFRTLGSRVARL